MKKITLFAFALAIAVNACTMDPVPNPFDADYMAYIQAQTVDGVPLCDLNTFAPRAIRNPLWVPTFVAPDGNILTVKMTESSSKVWIESTINNWSLKGMESYFEFYDPATDTWGNLLAAGYTVDFLKNDVVDNTTDNPNGLIVKDLTDNEIVKLTWVNKVIDLDWIPLDIGSYIPLLLPKYSDYLTVTRLYDYETMGSYQFMFVVKAFGYPSIGVDPAYTGFKVKFEAPAITPANVSIYVPDATVDARYNFLNLMNYNGGTRSDYKITLGSSKVETLLTNLVTALPEITDIYLYAPGTATYELRIRYTINVSGYLLWNCTIPSLTNPGNNPLTDVRITNANYTYSPTTWSYTTVTGNAAHSAFRSFIIQSTGFTILQDKEVFWFRSIADPNDWFKCEPFNH